MGTWAQTSDIEAAWRPLTTAESSRAETLIDSVERAIKRAWPTALVRIGMPTPPVSNGIDPDDVKDVVVWSVISILAVGDVDDIPVNAKSYQLISGQETVSITLDGSAAGTFLTFQPWMVDVFEDAALPTESTVPVPSGGAPASELGYADWIFREPGDPRFFDRRGFRW